MKKLNRKLLNQRKAANKRACRTYKADEGKPYSTHHYTEDREMHWCDITFRRGKKVYNTTFLSLCAAIDDAVGEASFTHPEFDLLPQQDGVLGRLPEYDARLELERRIHEEGVVVKAGVSIKKYYRYGTGLVVTFLTWKFTEDDILEFIAGWDGTDKNWGEFNSKDWSYERVMHCNQVKG